MMTNSSIKNGQLNHYVDYQFIKLNSLTKSTLFTFIHCIYIAREHLANKDAKDYRKTNDNLVFSLEKNISLGRIHPDIKPLDRESSRLAIWSEMELGLLP